MSLLLDFGSKIEASCREQHLLWQRLLPLRLLETVLAEKACVRQPFLEGGMLGDAM